jgi:hypothetical protein
LKKAAQANIALKVHRAGRSMLRFLVFASLAACGLGKPFA